MKKSLIALALALPLVASAQNLLTNGSFESGLTGWTASNSGELYPVAVISYSGLPGAFGEIVTPDNALSMSSDAVGTKAAYFVDDVQTQTLTQSFTVTTDGLYAVGFSYYVPSNGLGNPNGSSFSATIDATSLLNTPVTGPAQTWSAVSNQTVFLTAGSHSVTFSFTPTGFASEDVVIDRAFVTAVPEPETFALMAAGLAGIGFMARRRRA